MERITERAGVPTIVAILAIFVILYSLWGASLMHAQQQASSHDSNNAVATNI